MPNVVHWTVTSYFVSKFSNHSPMCHQIEEWKEYRSRFLYAQKSCKWPFAVKLWYGPFSANKRVCCSPHTMVGAFIVACPQQYFIEEILFDVFFKVCRIYKNKFIGFSLTWALSISIDNCCTFSAIAIDASFHAIFEELTSITGWWTYTVQTQT